MKLLLCSEGFHTPNTVQACVDLVGKPKEEIAIAVINEAFAPENGDKRWVLHNLNSAADNFPGPFDIVDLLALPIEEVEARIAKCDVIFVVGGNTDYLMHVYKKTGFDKLLIKLLETKVYVGSSAGSVVMGRRPASIDYQEAFGKEKDFGTNEYMELVNLAIRPHMDSSDQPKRREDVLRKSSQGLDFPVYGLKDDSAIIVHDEKIEVVGSEPYIVQPRQ
ncbi:MAG: peptidase E [Candidatus Saccharibacteria bacterium]|nr:peptidase E [Candidatus Saccharibacteria bacterium]